ncbi:MAG TPA: hypothetical protein VNO24_15440, partial [Blastocatellia bacterium]|nr:hypothetical protein [Blastocatellia bacterium]
AARRSWAAATRDLVPSQPSRLFERFSSLSHSPDVFQETTIILPAVRRLGFQFKAYNVGSNASISHRAVGAPTTLRVKYYNASAG